MSKLFLSPPYMGGKEREYVQEAFDSNWIAPLGPQVEQFESTLAARIGMPFALATCAGTAAIHLSLRALGVGKGDRVFCSSFTFAASCNPITYLGGEPVFLDSEPVTKNLSPVSLERALESAKREGKLPKAVIVVDLYGRSADWNAILPICEAYGVPVLEDAAEALGSTYFGKACGSFGDYSALSFNGNKIITTSGGGMAFCRDEERRKKMLFWATQAKEPVLHYEHKEIGYNYRLSNLCAAVGRGQLEILDEKLARRAAIAARYRKLLADSPVEFPADFEGNGENHWLNLVFFDSSVRKTPEEVCHVLAEQEIESRPAWKPMHLQPVYRDCRAYSHDGSERFLCEDFYRRGICLPSGDAMSEEAQAGVVRALLRAIE